MMYPIGLMNELRNMNIDPLVSKYWRTASAANDRSIKYLGGRTSFWEAINKPVLQFQHVKYRTGLVRDRLGDFEGVLGLTGISYDVEDGASIKFGPNGEQWFWELPCHFARSKPKLNQVYGWETTQERAMLRCDNYLAHLDYVVLDEKHRPLL